MVKKKEGRLGGNIPVGLVKLQPVPPKAVPLSIVVSRQQSKVVKPSSSTANDSKMDALEVANVFRKGLSDEDTNSESSAVLKVLERIKMKVKTGITKLPLG